MNEFQFLVLKGRHIQAQGKRSRETGSVALGWGSGNKIVRAIAFKKEKILFRTKEVDLVLSENDAFLFRQKHQHCSFQPFPADGFSSAFYTQGVVSDRSSRNFALGYYILAFQSEEI